MTYRANLRNGTLERLPRQPHRNLQSTNLPERLNEEIKRRTIVEPHLSPTRRAISG